MKNLKEKIISEIDHSYARSGGPGGQHANKTSSKVVARFDVPGSDCLSGEQKSVLMSRLSLTKEGELVVHAEQERSQHRNKEIANESIVSTVLKALEPEKVRVETKVPKKEKRRRVREKHMRSEKKRLRRPPSESD